MKYYPMPVEPCDPLRSHVFVDFISALPPEISIKVSKDYSSGTLSCFAKIRIELDFGNGSEEGGLFDILPASLQGLVLGRIRQFTMEAFL